MRKDQVVGTKKWALTDSAFAGLLRWLDADKNRAGEKYERLHQKLCLYFEHRACLSPDDLTDQTLDRVARKIESGDDLSGAEPSSYCYGVAHKILQEYWRSHSKETISLDSQPHVVDSPANATFSLNAENEDQDTELQLDCLHRCLQHLSPEDRELILGYYKGDHRERITSRHELAKRLEIPPGTLRIRALRIREQLRECINRCK